MGIVDTSGFDDVSCCACHSEQDLHKIIVKGSVCIFCRLCLRIFRSEIENALDASGDFVAEEEQSSRIILPPEPKPGQSSWEMNHATGKMEEREYCDTEELEKKRDVAQYGGPIECLEGYEGDYPELELSGECTWAIHKDIENVELIADVEKAREILANQDDPYEEDFYAFRVALRCLEEDEYMFKSDNNNWGISKGDCPQYLSRFKGKLFVQIGQATMEVGIKEVTAEELYGMWERVQLNDLTKIRIRKEANLLLVEEATNLKNKGEK